MNTDIRLNVSWLSHPKRKKLQRRLGPQGCLAFLDLLLEVAQNKPNGEMSGWSVEDIAIAGQWTGNENEFIEALLEIKLIDSNNGTYSIHDWDQHNPYAAKAEWRKDRARKGAAARWGEFKTHENASSNASSTNKQCTSPAPSPAPSPKERKDKIARTDSEKTGNGSEPPPPKIFLDDNFNWQGITDAHLTTWSQAYPACDIQTELIRSALYIRAHPNKRKRNWERYIIGWFGRAQEWGGTKGVTKEPWDIDAWAAEKDGMQ